MVECFFEGEPKESCTIVINNHTFYQISFNLQVFIITQCVSRRGIALGIYDSNSSTFATL